MSLRTRIWEARFMPRGCKQTIAIKGPSCWCPQWWCKRLLPLLENHWRICFIFPVGVKKNLFYHNSMFLFFRGLEQMEDWGDVLRLARTKTIMHGGGDAFAFLGVWMGSRLETIIGMRFQLKLRIPSHQEMWNLTFGGSWKTILLFKRGPGAGQVPC